MKKMKMNDEQIARLKLLSRQVFWNPDFFGRNKFKKRRCVFVGIINPIRVDQPRLVVNLCKFLRYFNLKMVDKSADMYPG